MTAPMNGDLLAAMTPEMLDGLNQVSKLLNARRKNKPGPGGPGPAVPAERRMGNGQTSELGRVRELLSSLGGD